jgi:hypothetical protein
MIVWVFTPTTGPTIFFEIYHLVLHGDNLEIATRFSWFGCENGLSMLFQYIMASFEYYANEIPCASGCLKYRDNVHSDARNP